MEPQLNANLNSKIALRYQICITTSPATPLQLSMLAEIGPFQTRKGHTHGQTETCLVPACNQLDWGGLDKNYPPNKQPSDTANHRDMR